MLAAGLASAAALASGGPATAIANQAAVHPATAGTISTVAGGVGGPAQGTQVAENAPCGLGYSAGNVYVANTFTVQQVDASGLLTTIAGTGSALPLGDGGPAAAAGLYYACGVAVDSHGNRVIADANENRIRLVAASTGTFYGQAMTNGNIYTIAGTGKAGDTGDNGRATRARLNNPYDAATDGAGNLVLGHTRAVRRDNETITQRDRRLSTSTSTARARLHPDGADTWTWTKTWTIAQSGRFQFVVHLHVQTARMPPTRADAYARARLARCTNCQVPGVLAYAGREAAEKAGWGVMSAADGSGRKCVGCGRPVSMYNPEDRCQSCLRSGIPPRRPPGERRRRVPDYLPAEILSRPDFRDACARHDFGTMFLIIHEYKDQGWTFIHIGRRCEIANIRNYTRCGTQPDRVYVIERVSDGLHIPGDMLRISRRPWESENANSNVVETKSVSLSDAGVAPWTVDGTLLSACEASEVGFMDRRSFLFLTGTALTVPAHDWLIAHPVTDVSRSAGRAIEPKHVDSLDEITGTLRHMDDQMGGGSLIDVVRAQAGYVIGLMRAGRYTDSTGRRLHGTLGELLRLGGWVAYDNGDQVRAQRSWIAALHAAHTAGDTALGANVLGFMSEQAWGVGKLHDAARLASTAVAGYKGSSPQVSSILRMRVARAHAMLGDTSDCRAAIDDAYDAFRNSPPEQGEPAWSYWMDETSLNEQIGKCFLCLGDYPAASHHLEMSLHSGNRQGSYVRDGVSVLIALANTHVQAGDPEQACAIAGKAVSALSGQVNSPRLIAKIKGLQDNLGPYEKVSAVQELDEKISNLSAESR